MVDCISPSSLAGPDWEAIHHSGPQSPISLRRAPLVSFSILPFPFFLHEISRTGYIQRSICPKCSTPTDARSCASSLTVNEELSIRIAVPFISWRSALLWWTGSYPNSGLLLFFRFVLNVHPSLTCNTFNYFFSEDCNAPHHDLRHPWICGLCFPHASQYFFARNFGSSSLSCGGSFDVLIRKIRASVYTYIMHISRGTFCCWFVSFGRSLDVFRPLVDFHVPPWKVFDPFSLEAWQSLCFRLWYRSYLTALYQDSLSWQISSFSFWPGLSSYNLYLSDVQLIAAFLILDAAFLMLLRVSSSNGFYFLEGTK